MIISLYTKELGKLHLFSRWCNRRTRCFQWIPSLTGMVMKGERRIPGGKGSVILSHRTYERGFPPDRFPEGAKWR